MRLSDLNGFKTGGFSSDYDPNFRTFYSPVDDVHGALKATLSSATQSLIVAMYGFDDDELSAILLDKLKSEGVTVQLTLDSSQAGGVHEKTLLTAWLDPTVDTPNSSIVSIGRSEKGAIQHQKGVVIDSRFVISGSTNWSGGGETKQDNQCTILDSRPEAAALRHRIDAIHLNQLQQMAAKQGATK